MSDLSAELTCALQHVADPEVVPGATSRRLLTLTIQRTADALQTAEARLAARLAADEELFNYALERERKLQQELSQAEARLADITLAAWDAHEVIEGLFDGEADEDDVRKIFNELGELLPAKRPTVSASGVKP